MPEEIPPYAQTVPHPSGTPIQPLEPPRSSLGCMMLTLVVLIAGGWAAWHFYKQAPAGTEAAGGKGGASHAVPVRVARVRAETVPVEIHGVGNVLPYSTVAVTAQVSGELTQVFFKEGDFVRQGQTLFAIDPRPQQASVDQLEANIAKDSAQIQQLIATVARDKANVTQAQANYAKDLAQQKFARSEEHRYGKLVRQGYVTVEQWQQEVATAQSSNATLDVDLANVASARETERADEASVNSQRETKAADEASLRNSEVQLGYTRIVSPINGRTGGLNVYAGNIVQANSTTALVTIAQIKPIYITFAIPEQYLGQVQALQAQHPLGVRVTFDDGTTAPENGRITFIDNNIDPTTGTIALRGTFTNANAHLWPGRFVTVSLILQAEANALVIPSQAVQPGQNGDYVFVVKPDNTAEMRPVKVERLIGTTSVIHSGLKPGETVVTDGQLQLTPGAAVEILSHRRKGPAGAESPAEAASGAPEASESPAAGGRHPHHHAPAPGAVVPSAAPSGSPAVPTPHFPPSFAPTEPVGTGPVRSSSPSPSVSGSPNALNFPATSSGGVATYNSTSTLYTGGGGEGGVNPTASTTPGSDSTGLPGSVNVPGVVARPASANTLAPVTLPVSTGSLPSNPPSFVAGPPHAPTLPPAGVATLAPAPTNPIVTTTATVTATTPTPVATSTAAPASSGGTSTTSDTTTAAAGGKK